MRKHILRNLIFYLGGLILPFILAIPLVLKPFMKTSVYIGLTIGSLVAIIIFQTTAKEIMKYVWKLLIALVIVIFASIGLSFLPKFTVPLSTLVSYYIVVGIAIVASAIVTFFKNRE